MYESMTIAARAADIQHCIGNEVLTKRVIRVHQSSNRILALLIRVARGQRKLRTPNPNLNACQVKSTRQISISCN